MKYLFLKIIIPVSAWKIITGNKFAKKKIRSQ
jgi:hypothetical protein